jgi:hypothetical protein
VTSHLGLMVLFAALVSPVFAALHRDDLRSGREFALKLFAALTGGAFALSWVLYFIFG